MPIVGEKQRTLFALLVLRADQVVPHDELLHALWGDHPPASGRRALHHHLWSLRRVLATDEALSTSSGGYALKVPPRGSDLAVFLAEVADADAARAGGDMRRAAERLRAALDLWRGPALAGTRLEFQMLQGRALEELRLSALSDRIEVDLALGRHTELISELRRLITIAPLRERFRAQLMSALNRDGRRADALQEYRLARQRLRDELGLEPGDELQRLHQKILAGDPERAQLADPVPPQEVQPWLRTVARQLPADIVRFTGRERHLVTLDTLLSTQGDTLPITAVVGAGGVGKTALAVHWGHRRSSCLPDGHLYVNLQGYSRSAPVTSGQALWQLLIGLGVPQTQIPVDMDERSTLYRSAMAGKRMLIVLDNAATADQVRPLLPGSPTSRVLITSRDTMRGLAATHDVNVVTLDMLPAEEAEALLRTHLDGEQDSAPIAELAALCDYLPLALRLAAAQLRDAGARADDLVTRLRTGRRLEALDFAEDPHSGIRATIASSYRALPEPVRTSFRIASLHPGHDLSLDALAAMTGQSTETTRRCLTALARAHLVNWTGQRVNMHDLVREYARELAEEEGKQQKVWERLLGWHVHTARAAMAHVDPDAMLLISSVPRPAVGVKEFTDRDSAMVWLNSEHDNTVTLVAHAARHGWPVHAWQLAYITAYYCYVARHIDDWITTHRVALGAVREVGDRGGEAKILTALGHALMEASQYVGFLACQRRAVELAVATGDKRMQAEALYYVAFGLFRTGDLTAAIISNDEALELYRERNDRAGEMATVYLAGQINLRLGKTHQALEYLDQILAWVRQKDRRHDEAYVLFEVATAHLDLRQLGAARESVDLALAIAHDLGDTTMETLALYHLGQVLLQQGAHLEALRLQKEALAHARELPERLTECTVLNGLGRAYAACGEPEMALEHFGAAVKIAARIEDPYQVADAHAGLAALSSQAGPPVRR
ncbi:BTAD domain-containing putative transcriptional regulator [Nonomuraea sp. ZG12]|uniref:AfsR/SARP family transcriptional regulator n=1 Tax=Nonomuraea sp. ZG12 TaxID=3452207 RepID=UPI003F889C77